MSTPCPSSKKRSSLLPAHNYVCKSKLTVIVGPAAALHQGTRHASNETKLRTRKKEREKPSNILFCTKRENMEQYQATQNKRRQQWMERLWKRDDIGKMETQRLVSYMDRQSISRVTWDRRSTSSRGDYGPRRPRPCHSRTSD